MDITPFKCSSDPPVPETDRGLSSKDVPLPLHAPKYRENHLGWEKLVVQTVKAPQTIQEPITYPISTVTKNVLFLGSGYAIVEPIVSSLFTLHALSNTFPDPIIITNTFKRQKDFHLLTLSSDAQTIMTLPNAGGNSINSEALSCDLLGTMFNASLEATEMELKYFPSTSKITDFSVRIRSQPFGVSVTRAMKHRGLFTEADAIRLLSKKLYGVNVSSEAVLERFKWKKQILHIWAQEPYIARILHTVYETLPGHLKNNTIVIITIARKADWIFYDR